MARPHKKDDRVLNEQIYRQAFCTHMMMPALWQENIWTPQLGAGQSIASPLPAKKRPTIGKPVAALRGAPSPSAADTGQCDSGKSPPKMSRFCKVALQASRLLWGLTNGETQEKDFQCANDHFYCCSCHAVTLVIEDWQKLLGKQKTRPPVIPGLLA